LSEVDVPVVDLAIGMTPRVHLTASVPRVSGGADPDGAAGGVGTSYVGAKIAVFDDARRHVKVSVSPTLEILGGGVTAPETSVSRVHVGVPVSAEVDRGAARLYAGAGFFS